MRWISPILALLLGVALILVPAPEESTPFPVPGSTEPPVAICPTEEGGGRSTDLAITSTVAGPGLITVFSGGSAADVGRFETGASGSVTVAMDEIAALGEVSSLVEFPSSDSAAASVVTGATSLSGETCARIPGRTVVLGGASTIEGRALQLQLMNPYATEALVDIVAFSESGRETAEALSAIIVPPRSSSTIDLNNVLPGRETLSLSVEVVRGSVVTSARADVAGDSAVWRPVAPEQSWFVPVPSYPSGVRELLIVSTGSADVAYQVDVYGPEGLEEAVLEGSFSGRGQQVVDLNGLSETAFAVRVVAEAPVGVFARFTGPDSLAMGSASAVSASDWLLPGAGSLAGPGSAVVIANVGLEATEVTLTELRDTSRSTSVTIASGQVVEIPLDEIRSDGVLISSDGEIVPFWLMQSGAAVAISSGTPMADG